MQKNQINQEENEGSIHRRHYHEPSTKDQGRFNAIVIDDGIEDWRDTVKKHIATENQKAMQPTNSYFELGLL